MNMEDRISDAAREFGRVGGFTTAGALVQITRDPSLLDSAIDGAAEPLRTELLEVKSELMIRAEAAKSKATQPTAPDVETGVKPENQTAAAAPADEAAGDEAAETAADDADSTGESATDAVGSDTTGKAE